jgi:Flp pilus assembly protein TadD
MIKLHGALKQAGQGKDADQRLAAWQKDHPDDVQLLMYLAEGNLADKQYKAAIDQLQVVLKQMPQNPIALNNLAWAYQQQKDPRALATAQQALQLAQNNPTISDTLGWILTEQGDTAHGLPLLKNAAIALPDDLAVHYHLASALAKSGDKIGARRELQQMLASGKTFAEEAQARALLKQL